MLPAPISRSAKLGHSPRQRSLANSPIRPPPNTRLRRTRKSLDARSKRLTRPNSRSAMEVTRDRTRDRFTYHRLHARVPCSHNPRAVERTAMKATRYVVYCPQNHIARFSLALHAYKFAE